MPTITRAQVPQVIRRICARPAPIFSVVCERRTDLNLRYDPIDQYTDGPLAYKGDASRLADQERVRFCDCGGADFDGGPMELVVTSRSCRFCKAKREKIVLQAAGTLRRMLVKGKNDLAPMKHWVSKGGSRNYNPAEHGLMPVAGMYRDAPTDQGTGKRIGRHGQWRSWAMICLRTVQVIKTGGMTIFVA